jgi:regulator of replication initiation timing
LDNEKFQTLVLKRLEMLDLIAAQVGKLTTQVDGLTRDMAEIKPRIAFIENTVVRIENDHGQKLGALLNGYKLHEERLDRHEAIISKKY